MTTLHNMTIRQGDSISLTLTVSQNGNPFNFAGSTFAFALARRANKRVEPQYFQTTWAYDSNLLLGTTVFKLTTVQTQGFLPQNYAYDIKVKDGTGLVTTILTGGLRVQPTPITPF